MGLFNFLKGTPENNSISITPYKEHVTNVIYNLLFCDDVNLFRQDKTEPYSYPYNILLSGNSSVIETQKIIDDPNADPRHKILACNSQLAAGHKPAKKELLAVIVEVALENGLDVLASFSNGTARYINYTGRVIIWESSTDSHVNEITNQLFDNSMKIVNQIGPWDKPRKAQPPKGNLRISFLVSDGLYFGEGPMNVLFNDAMAKPALDNATELMQYLTQQDLLRKP